MSELNSVKKIKISYEKEYKENEKGISINSRESVLMEKIIKYYEENEDSLFEFLSIISGESELSLRIIDFSTTCYSRNNEIIYEITNDKGQKEEFMVHYSYKSQLKAYSKKQFDPFCRRERINLKIEGLEKEPIIVRTTAGQANFFRWAINKGVIKYIKENLEGIITEMNNSDIKKGKTVKKKKDKQENFNIGTKTKDISLTARKKITRHDITITVKFE